MMHGPTNIKHRNRLNNRFSRFQSRYRCSAEEKNQSRGNINRNRQTSKEKLGYFVQNKYVCYSAPVYGICQYHSVGDDLSMAHRWNDTNRTKPNQTRRISCLSLALYLTNLTRNYQELNPRFRGERPVTDSLNYGTARVCCLITISFHKPYEHEQ